MGINFYTKSKKVNVDYDIGYGGMVRLRNKVAKLLDEEFGNHYESLSSLFGKEDFEIFDKKANEIISKNISTKEQELVLDFLFMPDSEGKLTYKHCKAIYDIIKDDTEETVIRYAFYSKNDWKDFKQILFEISQAKVNLYWH